MNKDTLKSMLNNLINDRKEEAALDLHNYLTAKMKEVTGLAEAQLTEEEVESILESATEEELEEAVRAFGAGSNNVDDWRPKSQAERNELAKAIKSQRRTNRTGDNERRAGALSAQGTVNVPTKSGERTEIPHGTHLPGWDKSRPNEKDTGQVWDPKARKYVDRNIGHRTYASGNSSIQTNANDGKNK